MNQCPPNFPQSFCALVMLGSLSLVELADNDKVPLIRVGFCHIKAHMITGELAPLLSVECVEAIRWLKAIDWR